MENKKNNSVKTALHNSNSINNLPPQNNPNQNTNNRIANIFNTILENVIYILGLPFAFIIALTKVLNEESEETKQYRQMYREMTTKELLLEKRKLTMDRLSVDRAESESRARGMFYQTQNPGIFSSWYMINKGIERRTDSDAIRTEINFHIGLIDEVLRERSQN